MPNHFSNQVSILAELWMNYRQDDGLKDFIEYNDMGLPLAYLMHNELVDARDQALSFIEETYSLLVAALGVEDKEYTSLDEMLQTATEM